MTQQNPGWAPSTPAVVPTREQMLQAVNAREPLDGTECGAARSLAGNLFRCANPADHPTWVDSRGLEGGHRFVHDYQAAS